MSADELKEKILSIARPLAEAQGLEIWGLDIKEPPARMVRLYVDVPLAEIQREADSKAEGGGEGPPLSASIEQCEEISRALGLALEVEECFDGPWTLEVSTPGLERKFFSLDQLKPYVGGMIEARLSERPAGAPEGPARRSWRGKLLSVDESGFDLEPASLGEDGRVLPENLPPVHVDWSAVQHARRLHVFGGRPKPGKGSKK